MNVVLPAPLADQPEQLTALDREVDVDERPDAAEADGDPACLEHRRHRAVTGDRACAIEINSRHRDRDAVCSAITRKSQTRSNQSIGVAKPFRLINRLNRSREAVTVATFADRVSNTRRPRMSISPTPVGRARRRRMAGALVALTAVLGLTLPVALGTAAAPTGRHQLLAKFVGGTPGRRTRS